MIGLEHLFGVVGVDFVWKKKETITTIYLGMWQFGRRGVRGFTCCDIWFSLAREKHLHSGL